MKPRTLRKANLITILAKTSQEPSREKTKKEVSVLDVGGKPQRIIPGKTHAIRQGLKNPIHIVPQVGFEPGSQRWKARQDTTTPT